jgi:hypothetical protein
LEWSSRIVSGPDERWIGRKFLKTAPRRVDKAEDRTGKAFSQALNRDVPIGWIDPFDTYQQTFEVRGATYRLEFNAGGDWELCLLPKGHRRSYTIVMAYGVDQGATHYVQHHGSVFTPDVRSFLPEVLEELREEIKDLYPAS